VLLVAGGVTTVVVVVLSLARVDDLVPDGVSGFAKDSAVGGIFGSESIMSVVAAPSDLVVVFMVGETVVNDAGIAGTGGGVQVASS